MSSNPADEEVYSIQHYVLKFVIDLRQVGGFLRFSPPIKTDRHDISKILLKVALNTITLTIELGDELWQEEEGYIFIVPCIRL